MMGLGEFLSPSKEEWIDALGADPEPLGDEESIYQVKVSIDVDEAFDIIVDVPGNSVRLRWISGNRTIVDVFRESARRMSVRSGGGEAHIEIEFVADGLAGRYDIQILPKVAIRDSLLFA